MTDPLLAIPLEAIDEAALTRDRTGLDPEPQTELELSIAASGLRQPIEVFPLAGAPGRYGLLTGFRRLQAFRTLLERTGEGRYAAISAFVRAETSLAAALAAMVEENDMRADLSPFERGLIAVTARNLGAFASIEEAVERLYPNAGPMKRSRLRSLAFMAEEIDGLLASPEKLNPTQAARLASALRLGFGKLISMALGESSACTFEAQWALIVPILAEAERAFAEDPVRTRGDRPRRILHPRPNLTIRREMTRDGWILRFTGRDATGLMLNTVMDEIERMYGPS